MALIFKRSIHCSAPRQGPNPFFHLQALSNARETARATQLSKLPRTAHSPQLQLLEAEASLTPLTSNAPPKPSKDPHVAVNIAKAGSPKAQITPESSQCSHVVAQPAHIHPEMLKELRSVRQEFAEWQASVDQRLAFIAYDLKRIHSNQGSTGWLVAFGALFFICSWGLVTFAAEKKIQRSANVAIRRKQPKAAAQSKPRREPETQVTARPKPQTRAQPVVPEKAVAGSQRVEDNTSLFLRWFAKLW